MSNFFETKSEKVLVCLGLVMAAMVIGYNLFFEPQVPSVVQNTGNIVTDKYAEEDPKKSSANFLVNINTASEEELVENLNGIGPALAKRILEYRESNGGFSSKEELMNVKGIGEKMFEKLKNQITVK